MVSNLVLVKETKSAGVGIGKTTIHEIVLTDVKTVKIAEEEI